MARIADAAFLVFQFFNGRSKHRWRTRFILRLRVVCFSLIHFSVRSRRTMMKFWSYRVISIFSKISL